MKMNSEEDLEMMKAFGNNLKKAISRKKVTRYKVAESIGVHDNTIDGWIAGRINPSLTKIMKLVDYFKDRPELIVVIFPELKILIER